MKMLRFKITDEQYQELKTVKSKNIASDSF